MTGIYPVPALSKEVAMGRIDFAHQRVTFPSRKGVQQQLITFVFKTEVLRAECAISGFDIGFTGKRPELRRMRIDTHVGRTPGNIVEAAVDFAIRDNSGVFDDSYEGYVDVLCIVDRQI